MSVKSWGDAWVVELLSPRTTSFLLPLHLQVVHAPALASNSMVLQVNCWEFFCTAVSQCPGAEHLKNEDRQPPKDVHPSWNPTNRGPRQELGNELKNGWQVSRPRHHSELWWALLPLWNWGCLILIEHLPGEASALGSSILWESKEKTAMERKPLA